MMKTQFHFQTNCDLKNRILLKTFIQEIFRAEGSAASELNFIFCDKDYLLGINKSFLHHNYYTDIITFDMSENGGPIIGEIYISIEIVRENASRFQATVQNELYRVMFHGVLHLTGYKDKSKNEKLLMRQKEDFYLARFLKLI